jgi:hypothetical protein
MIEMTNEMLNQVVETYHQMAAAGLGEQTFGPGFILVRNYDALTLCERGEVIYTGDIDGVPIAVLSPGVSHGASE